MDEQKKEPRCPKCNNKRIVKENNKILFCTACIDEDKLIQSLKAFLENNETNKSCRQLVTDVRAILSFLPDYPVMAIMEAAERGFNVDAIQLMKKVFKVRNLK